MTKNGAQLLVECLFAHGVTHVFGVPGGYILNVFNALIDFPIQVVICGMNKMQRSWRQCMADLLADLE